MRAGSRSSCSTARMKAPPLGADGNVVLRLWLGLCCLAPKAPPPQDLHVAAMLRPSGSFEQPQMGCGPDAAQSNLCNELTVMPRARATPSAGAARVLRALPPTLPPTHYARAACMLLYHAAAHANAARGESRITDTTTHPRGSPALRVPTLCLSHCYSNTSPDPGHSYWSQVSTIIDSEYSCTKCTWYVSNYALPRTPPAGAAPAARRARPRDARSERQGGDRSQDTVRPRPGGRKTSS
eukprot:COSAG02_NODE_42_length_46522_cov_109.704478_39_plen_239_part_00